MAHHTRVRADLAAWGNGAAITPEEFDKLDQNAFESINGDEGSTHAPTSRINIGGQGMRLTGPFNAEQVDHGFTDLSVPKNIIGIHDLATFGGQSPIWVSAYARWYLFGHSSGIPTGKHYDMAQGFVVQTIPAGANLTFISSACNPSGVIVIGGTPGSASRQKFRETSDGATWNTRESSVTNNGTEGVGRYGLIWHPAASLFVAGLDNAASTNIETSPDGQTWTNRTGANAHARGAAATNGSTIVMLASTGTTTDKCQTSTDGVTWNERTLPTSQSWRSVVWDLYYQRFIAFGATRYAYSSNGTTWTDGGVVPASDLRVAITTAGRVLMAVRTGAKTVYGGSLSADGTQLNLQKVAELTGNGADLGVGGGEQQFFLCDNQRVYWTIRGGML